MNLVSIETGKVSININGPITVDGNIYESLTFIARLLSVDELFRIDRFLSNNIEAESILEENIFDLCVENIVGLDASSIEDVIDKNVIEAGIITTISYAILRKSQTYISADEDTMNSIASSLTILDSMLMVISRFSSTPYSEVKKIPINEVIRRFSVISKTFPGQFVLIGQDEE